MPKKGGSLTFPKDPLAAMQELSELDAPQPVNIAQHGVPSEPSDTYSNTEVSNEISNLISNQVSNDDLQPAPTVLSPSRRSRAVVSKPLATPLVSTPQTAIPQTAIPQTAIPQTARRRLLAQAEKEATTRLSIDVPLPMYNRIKQYIAVNNVESIRALTLALYEDFLTEEQF